MSGCPPSSSQLIASYSVSLVESQEDPYQEAEKRRHTGLLETGLQALEDHTWNVTCKVSLVLYNVFLTGHIQTNEMHVCICKGLQDSAMLQQLSY